MKGSLSIGTAVPGCYWTRTKIQYCGTDAGSTGEVLQPASINYVLHTLDNAHFLSTVGLGIVWCSLFICGLTAALGLEELVLDTCGRTTLQVKIT